MWALVLPLSDKALKVCQDIAKKDKSFLFGVDESHIIVYCESKDKAYRRGYWMKFKAGIAKFDIVKVVR